MKIKKIVIIGLGLMGASLAAACRRRFPGVRVIGISRNAKARSLAKRKKWIHEGTKDYSKGLEHADLVVLCTPVTMFSNLLDKINRYGKQGVIVTDVGSVKGSVVKLAAKRRKMRYDFIGAHPMVGSHQRGPQFADVNLYKKGFTFLIKDRRNNRDAYRIVKRFWKALSPSVVELSAGDHDRIVSEISHLPHAAALALMLTAGNRSLKFAATGFRDTTRIAAGHPSVWLPIFVHNRKEVVKSLLRFESQIKRVRRALSGKDLKNLEKLVMSGSKRRTQI